MKITLFKKTRKTETINRVELGELVQMIAAGDHQSEVRHLRMVYHLMRIHRQDDGSVETDFEDGVGLPRVCFAAEYEHRGGERRLLNYNMLAVVEVNNLATYDEAIAVRNAARQVPQTLLCFQGASGRSVKIVCRGEGRQPQTPADIETFHQQLYQMARRAYSAQLDLNIESLPPRLDRTVYLSADPDIHWNEQAIPFYITQPSAVAAQDCAPVSPAADFLMPGRTLTRSYQMNYLFILEQVLGAYFDLPDEQRQGELLMQVAGQCLEEGIPMGIAQNMTLAHPVLNSDEMLVRKTFQAVYTVEHLKEYQEKHKMKPLKSVPEDTLLMMKTEAFLNANYEMRKNVMTGVAQYRERSSDSYTFHDLDQEARNDMTIRAKELGLKSWDKDIDRFIDSTRIEKYDPVNDWLDRLPRWDGRDRITPLADRVPTDQPHWQQYFRTWMLGMVAHWMGRSSLTGNALVPLLIGRQGCGKSSFCRILLPPALRDYYNDRISFKNDTDLNLGLTSFALINIDEFDKVTQRQQVLLKYLLSTADVKFRPPYGKAVKQYRRYASFIGTTNEPKPLNDPTGSRRFVCVAVTGDIDFTDNLDHQQLYAQLRQLVDDGERYWLNDEETATLISENDRFQRVNALEEMIAETFCHPDEQPGKEGRWWTLAEVADVLKNRYRSQDTRTMTLQTLGRVLNIPRFHFDNKRRKTGMVYWLAERLAVLVALLLLVMPALQAGTIGEERMISPSMADGLAGESVYQVMTAHDGIVWIATSNGVNVYNGRQMITIPVLDENGRTVAVRSLCETKNHIIYAATDNGLYRIYEAAGRFDRVLPEVQQPLTLYAIGDTVYIGSRQGLMVYDGHQLKHQDVDVSRHGLDNIVRQYAVCEEGKIWFLGRFDLNSYDPKTDMVTRHKLSLPVNKMILTQFTCLGNGRFAIGTRGNGLFLYNLNTNQAERVEGVGNLVSSVCRSTDGSVCVATDGAGAYLLEIIDNRLEIAEHFSTEGDADHRLPSNATYCYYRDKNGVNWFGFVRYGLAYTYHCGELFKPFRVGDFTTEGLNVRSFCRHEDDVIIGTQNGFYYVNAKTGQHRYYAHDDLGGGHIVNTICWYEGRFYIGTFDGGLRQFDPQTMVLSRQSFTPLLDDVSIGDVKAGPDGRLWVGCGHGLIIIGNGQVEQHFTEQNSRIVGGLILDITFDASGNGWLTGEKGCSLYSARSQSIVDTTFPKGFFNEQPWMRGALGHDGLVFMRNGPQTFYTNEQMTDFGELQLPITFKDKWCRSFVDDMKGHYLLTSERGLFGFDYDLKEMIHFGYGEGLCGDFINDMFIGQKGTLVVATSQGLFLTTLDSLATWKKGSRYQVRLYNIRRGSDLLPMEKEYLANEKHTIRLKWNMKSQVLQAELILPDYSKQTGRMYEYRLGGGDWQLVEDGQPIYVKGLLIGQHRLEVRLAGAEGTTSVYTITVVPSFWAIFELVLLVIALAALWLWWRWRKNTKVLLSERDEIEDALIEVQQELEDISLTSTLSPLTSDKYQKVKVDEEECADIVSRMKEYLDRERVYTNADLKMKDLADVLHLSAPKLSQVFNIYLGQNYYDFINGYRLAEFKRLIEEGEFRRYTITALSEKCGFKKSNFFSTFRKVEGMSPAEYLKKKGVKMT